MRKLTLLAMGMIFAIASLCAENATFKNPILSGFHPDPSICRVGDEYYMVNSSFEWFPGIPIYKSKDLINWKLIGYGVTRPEQMQFADGLQDSRGIYAVTIRHHDGLFYLITTCVQCGGNFYITAKDPAGPWSDPVWLHSQGIDPSLFWDEDGKCYYVGHGNMSGKNDWPDKNGAWLQELDTKQGKLVGKRVQLTHGHASNARWTEGPHIYKINGKYMLLVAEGGTGYFHSVTVFHSDSIWGPYIPDHANPVLTHRHLGKDSYIHSVGHADLVQTQNGEWWAVSLAKRHFDGYTYLARETFLTPVEFQKLEGVKWETPIFNPGKGGVPEVCKRPNLPWSPVEKTPVRDNFDADKLALEWNFLRTPMEKWYELKDGHLALELRPQVADSLVNPSLVARRIEHIAFTASAKMKFSSRKSNEQTGMIVYRVSNGHVQFIKSGNELVLVSTTRAGKKELARVPYKKAEVVLRIVSDGKDMRFYYGESEDALTDMGVAQPLSIISDEKVSGGFNGPYVGMYATSNGKSSKSKVWFDWFDYEGK